MATTERLRATSKWRLISRDIKLSENIIRRNQLRVNWPFIFQFQKLSVSFIREFINVVQEENLWDIVAQYQTLDLDFIREYRASLNWNIVLEFQSLTTRFVPADCAVATSVTVNGSNYVFSFPKNRLRDTVDQFSTYTTMDVVGSNVTANNKSYTIVSVAETSTAITVTTSTSYTLVGVTEYGWASFPESAKGDTSFLEDVVILPYLHKGNNLSRPFRDELSQHQSLTETYIVANYLQLNMKNISLNQNLTDLFIAKYDVDSTMPGSTPTITFDFDQIVIGQDMVELLEDPNYTDWIKDKLNFQLLLKYQNLSRDFVLANLDNLQLPEIGRFNRNLSDVDLQQIEEDNPFLTETTDRPGSVRFAYEYGDIVDNLRTAGFDFEEGRPVGYVFYHRNGSLLNKRNLDISVAKGAEVSVPQVDIDEDNPGARNGITVLNGDTIIGNPERQSYKIAKVAVPIISREIDQPATGTISWSPKSSYGPFDRFNVGDDNGRETFEFDIIGDNARSEVSIYNIFTFTSIGGDNSLTTSKPHRLSSGDQILVYGVSLPTPLLEDTPYYIIDLGTSTMRLAASREDALTNRPIDIANGTGNIARQDSKFSLEEDINVYTGQPVLFLTSSSEIAPISGGITPIVTDQVDYHLIKESNFTVRVAESEENAKNNTYITITGQTSGYTLTSNAIPINIRSTDIVRGSEVAQIMNRVFNNLIKITTDGTPPGLSDFDVDPWYLTVKNGGPATTNFQDFSASFTADAGSNRIILGSTLPIENGDPLSFSGSLPTPLQPNTIYYAIVINGNEIEIADDEEDADQRIPINLVSNGSGTVFPSRVNLTNDISLHTGNRVEVTSDDLPTGLSDSTIYYVNKISPTRIEFCTTLENAFNGTHIPVQRTGSSAKTLVAEDYNMVFGSGGRAIVHFKTDRELFVEVVTGGPIHPTDTFAPRGISSPQTPESVEAILNVSSTKSLETTNLISTLPSNARSQGNVDIERFTDNLNTIKVQGMDGGFEDTIIDENARGVGVIIEELGRLRAFSVEMIDNDYFDGLRF
jgi:hypothetical protein